MRQSETTKQRGRWLSFFVGEAGDGQNQGHDTLTSEDIDKANTKLFDDITSLSDERMAWAESMHRYLEMSFRILKGMCEVAFIIGLILLILPFFAFYLSPSHDSNLLWFSGIGLAETVAILVYKPIDRIQKATSDMVQSTMILSSWASDIATIMYLVDLKHIKKGNNSQEIETYSKLVRGSTEAHVTLLEAFGEGKTKK